MPGTTGIKKDGRILDLMKTAENRAPIHLLFNGPAFSLNPELPPTEVRKRQNTVKRTWKVVQVLVKIGKQVV